MRLVFPFWWPELMLPSVPVSVSWSIKFYTFTWGVNVYTVSLPPLISLHCHQYIANDSFQSESFRIIKDFPQPKQWLYNVSQILSAIHSWACQCPLAGSWVWPSKIAGNWALFPKRMCFTFYPILLLSEYSHGLSLLKEIYSLRKFDWTCKKKKKTINKVYINWDLGLGSPLHHEPYSFVCFTINQSKITFSDF